MSPHYLRLVAFVIPPAMPLGSAYDVEGWRGNDRHHFNAIVQIPDLVDYYWQPFKACVQEAEAGSIMCSCAYVDCCASVPAAVCTLPTADNGILVSLLGRRQRSERNAELVSNTSGSSVCSLNP